LNRIESNRLFCAEREREGIIVVIQLIQSVMMETSQITEHEGEREEETEETVRWFDCALPEKIGTEMPIAWYSENDGCLYTWGGCGEDDEQRRVMVAVDLTAGMFERVKFEVMNAPNPDTFPSFCARQKNRSLNIGDDTATSNHRTNNTPAKKNKYSNYDDVLTFLSGGAEEGEAKTVEERLMVTRTYDYALKKWNILDVQNKSNGANAYVPEDRFGASSTFISDTKVLQFGGVKKYLDPTLKKPKSVGKNAEKDELDNKKLAAFTNETNVFDFEAKTWTANTTQKSTKKLPPARAFASLVSAIDDVAVLFGGINSSDQYLGDIWMYDARDETPRWKEILPTETEGEWPSPRAFHSATALPDGDGMLVAGGRDEQGTYLKEVWVFSFELKIWARLIPGMSPNVGFYGATLVCARSGVFRIGGVFEDEKETAKEIWVEETNNSLSKKKSRTKKEKVYVHSLTTSNTGAAFLTAAGRRYDNPLTNPVLWEIPGHSDDEDRQEDCFSDILPLKGFAYWGRREDEVKNKIKTTTSAKKEIKIGQKEIAPATKTNNDEDTETQKKASTNKTKATSNTTTQDTPRAGIRSAFEPVKGSHGFKIDGRSAPVPAAPAATCEYCNETFQGKTRNQTCAKHVEKCSKNPRNIKLTDDVIEKFSAPFAKKAGQQVLSGVEQVLTAKAAVLPKKTLPALKLQQSHSHGGGDLPTLSPRANREEVLVPGVRMAPSDDEEEDKEVLNAVNDRKKKLKKQPSKLGRSSSSQMKVASAGSGGEIGGSGGAGATAGGKEILPAPASDYEKNMPPKKRKIIEDGKPTAELAKDSPQRSSDNDKDEDEDEEAFKKILDMAGKKREAQITAGLKLTEPLTEENALKTFASCLKLSEDALKELKQDKAVWDKEKSDMFDSVAKFMDLGDHEKIQKILDDRQAANKQTTTMAIKKLKTSSATKVPRAVALVGGRIDASKSTITGNFDSGYFAELVIDGKKCTGVFFSPVMQTTTDSKEKGKIIHRIS
jgi:hypothetical protein